MKRDGWTLEPKWSWSLGILYLDPTRQLSDLIPRPALHHGRGAALTWTKPVADGSRQRLVARAWRTEFEIGREARTYPLFVMSLMRERLRKGLSLYAVPSAVRATADERKALAAVVRAIPGTQVLIAAGAAANSAPVLVDSTH
jgi:hypothetical protein